MRLITLIALLFIATQTNAQELLAQAKPVDSKEWGYINAKGEFVIDAQYRNCHPFSEGLAPIYDKKERTFYFIKPDGSKLDTDVKEFKLRNIFGFGLQGFSDDMVAIETDRQWGYLNAKGKLMVPAKFDKAHEFNSGFGVAEKDDKFYIIGKDGSENQVEINGLEDVRKFSEGLAPYRANGQWGFINSSGEVVIEAKYRAVGYMNDGFAWVKNDDGQVGFINANGDEKIAFEYTAAKDFTNGMARIRKGDNWIYLTEKGTVMTPPSADTYGKFSEGLAYYKTDGKVGFINKEGQSVIKQQFDAVRDFSNGLAAAEIDGKWGFIDKSGNWVIKPQFDAVKDFAKVN
jgi:hypothetical protein